MTTSYDESNIRVLEGLEAVRVRPGMYIGSTRSSGLHHLVYEVVDNSIEEALAGHCQNIDISINADGSMTVVDDGRGIESERDSQTGKFSIETIFTTLHWGKYRDCDYRIGGGFYGVGLAVVSALSSHLEVKVWHEGKTHTQSFERGIAVSGLETVSNREDRTGTSITFSPDPEIFQETIEFDFDILASRLRELAYLNAGIRISFTDYRLESQGINEPKPEHYYYESGLRDYLAYLNRDKQPLHEEIIYAKAEKDRIRVEVALQWCTDVDRDCVLGFANTTRTVEGGKHIDGFKMALTRTVNKIASQQNKLRSNEANLSGEYIREGLTAIVSVLLPNIEWAGPTRTALASSQAQGVVDSIASEALTVYLASHPDVADAIIVGRASPLENRAIQAFNLAEAKKQARKQSRVTRTDIKPS
jgi:DNA gyrase subunit B